MSAHDLHFHGKHGMATLNGSAHDATPYRSTSRAKAFIGALLDPAATVIRRKNGNVFHKLRHVLVYRSEPAILPISSVTDDMRVVYKTKADDGIVYASVQRPVLNAKLTFHEQTDFPTSVYTGSAAPVNKWKKTKSVHNANVSGKQCWNKNRDW
jgi:hypothetical protein